MSAAIILKYSDSDALEIILFYDAVTCLADKSEPINLAQIMIQLVQIQSLTGLDGY